MQNDFLFFFCGKIFTFIRFYMKISSQYYFQCEQKTIPIFSLKRQLIFQLKASSSIFNESRICVFNYFVVQSVKNSRFSPQYKKFLRGGVLQFGLVFHAKYVFFRTNRSQAKLLVQPKNDLTLIFDHLQRAKISDTKNRAHQNSIIKLNKKNFGTKKQQKNFFVEKKTIT